MLFYVLLLCAVATSTLGRPHEKRDGMLAAFTTTSDFPTHDWTSDDWLSDRPSSYPSYSDHPTFHTRRPYTDRTNDWFSNLASEWATFHGTRTYERPTGYTTRYPHSYATDGGHHSTTAPSTAGSPQKRDGMRDPHTTAVTGLPTNWPSNRPTVYRPQYSEPTYNWDSETTPTHTERPYTYQTNDWFSNLASDWATFHGTRTYESPSGYTTRYPYGYATDGGHYSTTAASTAGTPQRRDGMRDPYTTAVTGLPTNWPSNRPTVYRPQYSEPTYNWDSETTPTRTERPYTYQTNDWFSNLASDWATYHTREWPTGPPTTRYPYAYHTRYGPYSTTTAPTWDESYTATARTTADESYSATAPPTGENTTPQTTAKPFFLPVD